MREISVSVEDCIGCGACVKACVGGVVTIEDREGRRYITFPRGCEESCVACEDVCPTKAISFHEERATGDSPIELVFSLVRCERCGAPFTTERIMGYLESRLHDRRSRECLCPTCRQHRLCEALRGKGEEGRDPRIHQER